MEITVKSYFHKGSARKIRPILGVIKRKNAKKVLESLKFMNKNGSIELHKMIQNGINQAEDNNLEIEKLIIKKVQCDKAKELKRHRFESKGRVARIKKHQHHIFLVLSDGAAEATENKIKDSKVITKNEPKKDK